MQILAIEYFWLVLVFNGQSVSKNCNFWKKNYEFNPIGNSNARHEFRLRPVQLIFWDLAHRNKPLNSRRKYIFVTS